MNEPPCWRCGGLGYLIKREGGRVPCSVCSKGPGEVTVCPTCSSPVEIVAGEEGTNSYRPIDSAQEVCGMLTDETIEFASPQELVGVWVRLGYGVNAEAYVSAIEEANSLRESRAN